MFERFQTPVRCSEGHLYTSTWVPFTSFKAARLGPNRRFQRCPVGHHWAMTTKLDPETLSASDRRAASKIKDWPVI